jgi:hypothetical protein
MVAPKYGHGHPAKKIRMRMGADDAVILRDRHLESHPDPDDQEYNRCLEE